jgi:hypothetical protein
MRQAGVSKWTTPQIDTGPRHQLGRATGRCFWRPNCEDAVEAQQAPESRPIAPFNSGCTTLKQSQSLTMEQGVIYAEFCHL